ncbi:MAG: cob(I)yrinic acid a,c-diamide adenosyltransferase [Bacteroidetes bacterium]|nr:cob(I)yrinic acid a,c-diamide adenosyltransferase [Bacteroidota bacterium]
MKIYTKKGDAGKTGLIGGTRVPKHSVRIEAYGTVDELNSHLGILRDRAVSEKFREEIIFIQDRLFTLGSLLAVDPAKSKMELPQVHATDVEYLEKSIDAMESELEPMKFFVLPGGHETVSFCHIARCVCRRAERRVCELDEQVPQNPIILAFLNRLSDYLFVYGRYVSHKTGAIEIPWKPKH